MSLRIKRIRNLEQIREFIKIAAATDTVPSRDRAEAYRFIAQTLVRFEFHRRSLGLLLRRRAPRRVRALRAAHR